jgi:hypothetical protein
LPSVAPLPSGPRQRGPAARQCLAAAPLSSSGSGLLPSLRWGRLLAQRFSPSRLPHRWALLWPLLTPPRPSGAVTDTLLRFARKAGEVSHGKTLHFLGATAGSTRARDGRSIGRPRPSPGCPTALALYPMSVRRLPDLPPASSPPRIAATQLPLAIGSAPCGRVGMWRGGVRSTMSVAAPFVWRCLSGSAITPFPHPAHRTQQADFPHCALGQDLTPSPTTGRAHAGSDVRARSARRGARVDTSRLGVA